MGFYNNIYASSYRFYARFKGETPWSTSIVLVTICQIELFFLVLTIVKKITGYSAFLLLPNKFYFLPIFILWLLLMFRYYSKERVANIVEDFGKKEKRHRRMWGVLTLICFLVPLVLILVLLKK